jgi:hypothetical protein
LIRQQRRWQIRAFHKDLVLEKSYCDENGLMFGSTRLLILPKILKVESIAKHDKLVAYEAKVS